jgi:hypothetical protein
MQKQNQTNYHKAGRTREIAIKGQPIYVAPEGFCAVVLKSLYFFY